MQDIIYNLEFFKNYTYIYKDKGAGNKWKFCTKNFLETEYRTEIWSKSFKHTWFHYTIDTMMCELWKFTKLQNKVIELWKDFQANEYDKIYDIISKSHDKIIFPYVNGHLYSEDEINQELSKLIENLILTKDFLNRIYNVHDENETFIVPEDETFCYNVFFRQDESTKNWDTVKIYWDDYNIHPYIEWPGVDMKRVKIDGEYYWYYRVITEDERLSYQISFNNGSKGIGVNETKSFFLQRRYVYKMTGAYASFNVGQGSGVDYIKDDSNNSYEIRCEPGAIIVTSDTDQSLNVVSIDGTTKTLHISAGENRFDFEKGVYVINGKKYLL